MTATALPTPPIACADVTRLIAAFRDSQNRGGVSRDFAECLTDLATRCELPVPEFSGVLDGVREAEEDHDGNLPRVPELADAPDGGPCCDVHSPSGFVCTRSPTHNGDHVARCGPEAVFARWPQ